MTSFISNINFFHLAVIMSYDALFFLFAPVTFGLFSTAMANLIRKSLAVDAPRKKVGWGIARLTIVFFTLAAIPFVTLCVISNWQTIVTYMVIGGLYGVVAQYLSNMPINREYNQAKIMAAFN